LTGIIDRLVSCAESWQARRDELCTGRLLVRFPAVGRAEYTMISMQPSMLPSHSRLSLPWSRRSSKRTRSARSGTSHSDAGPHDAFEGDSGSGRWFNLEVIEARPLTPDVDVLIGMDLLVRMSMIWDGPNRQVILTN
jgi:hypothetical protein